jgi:Family of unknown function (DUF5808)
VGKRVVWVAEAAAAGLLVGAVVTELRKPAEQRTWHGRVVGGVPYDLRPPTLARFRAALWDPSKRSVLVPHPFGVGWTVNVARVWELVRRG